MRSSNLLPTVEEQADEMRNILWSKYPKPISKSSDKILVEEQFPSLIHQQKNLKGMKQSDGFKLNNISTRHYSTESSVSFFFSLLKNDYISYDIINPAIHLPA